MIGSEWSKIARQYVGNKHGEHCHWCAHIKHDDGESFCSNPESKFCDGDRIRTWDGEGCAEECGVFKLDPWYEDDANIQRYIE